MDNLKLFSKVEKDDSKTKRIMYINPDKTLLKRARIRYLVYGILISVLSLALLAIESFRKYDNSSLLDNVFSFAALFNVLVGGIYIVKFFKMDNMILGDSMINLVNYVPKMKDEEVVPVPSMSFLRLCQFISFISSMAIIAYLSAVAFWFADTDVFFGIAMALMVILEIVIVLSIVSVDKEDTIYMEKLVAEKEVKERK